MLIKKYIAAFTAALTLSFSLPYSSFAVNAPSEEITYTVTFCDFDGNYMDSLTVGPDEIIDYSLIDTSSLQKHIDVYTEQAFSSWNMTPETTDCDITIYALSKTAVLSIDQMPSKTRYYSRSGNVSLDGLKVSITIHTQTPQLDGNNKYIVTTDVIDISSSCIAEPAALDAAFANASTATISIYPIGENKPIGKYTINCVDGHGDVNSDGRTNAVDASLVLKKYAEISSDGNAALSDSFKKSGDVNYDGKINSVDASFILRYYAKASSNEIPDWDEIISNK